jgi:hypothetical protein
MYKTSAGLLDYGFNIKTAALKGNDKLPPLPAPAKR